jgi:putative Ca2+/H+ antiporter (TMEM165/GDT1 family)
MEIKTFLLVFGTIFLAELGDKTQLATMLYSTDRETSKLLVFLSASLALICTSAIGVLFGHLLSKAVNPRTLTIGAGAIFIVVGCITMVKGFKAA